MSYPAASDKHQSNKLPLEEKLRKDSTPKTKTVPWFDEPEDLDIFFLEKKETTGFRFTLGPQNTRWVCLFFQTSPSGFCFLLAGGFGDPEIRDPEIRRSERRWRTSIGCTRVTW